MMKEVYTYDPLYLPLFFSLTRSDAQQVCVAKKRAILWPEIAAKTVTSCARKILNLGLRMYLLEGPRKTGQIWPE